MMRPWRPGGSRIPSRGRGRYGFPVGSARDDAAAGVRGRVRPRRNLALRLRRRASNGRAIRRRSSSRTRSSGTSACTPTTVDRVRNAEQLLFDSKEQLNLEYRIVGHDGRARWVWERNTIVRDARGVPICTHGTVLDLSRFGVDKLDASRRRCPRGAADPSQLPDRPADASGAARASGDGACARATRR